MNKTHSLIAGKIRRGGLVLGLPFLFVIIAGCSELSSRNKNNDLAYLDLKKVNTYTAPLKANQGVNQTFYYHVQRDSIITYLDRNNKTIWLWNVLRQCIVDSINVNRYPDKRHYLTNYKILSSDSLILSYMPTYFGFQHDSVLMMVDTNQKVLANFSFKGAPVPMKQGNPAVKADLSRKTEWAFQIHNNTFPIVYNARKDAVLTKLSDFADYNTKELNGTVGWAYRDTSIGFKKLPIQFRPSFEGYFPTEYRYFIGDVDDHHNLVLGKGYTDHIKKYNLNTGSLDSNAINFYSIDTVRHFATKAKADKHEKYLNYYRYIRYDPYKQWFWRTAKLLSLIHI